MATLSLAQPPIVSPTTEADNAAYALGRQDAQAGHYNPTAIYHYNDPRIMHYDAGYTSVRPTLWTWTDGLSWQDIEAEQVGNG